MRLNSILTKISCFYPKVFAKCLLGLGCTNFEKIFYLNHIKKNYVVFDLGANRGYFTDGITVTGSINHDGDLTVTGTVVAQEFKTEFVSAAIIYQSGSTKCGDTSDDTHSFTGSLGILSGSLT